MIFDYNEGLCSGGQKDIKFQYPRSEGHLYKPQVADVLATFLVKGDSSLLKIAYSSDKIFMRGSTRAA